MATDIQVLKAREQAARDRLAARIAASPDEVAHEQTLKQFGVCPTAGRISHDELRQAVKRWQVQGIRSLWPLRLLCLCRAVSVAELLSEAAADGEITTGAVLARREGWIVGGGS